jgi:Pectate lyase superfamily protein
MSAELVGRRLLLGGVVGALAATRAQADTNFTNFRFPATGASAARTMPDRLAEIKNVKDFGAVGDGRNDDTAAIQAAFDAAFGSSASSDSAHGQSGKALNSPVFFPTGTYKTTSALTLRSAFGGLIFGAGMQDTVIVNVTNGGTVIRTNGCAYTCFRDLSLVALNSTTNSIALDLDWDNTGNTALNANYFENVNFSGEIGTNIGVSGYMGSENVFVNCYWSNCSSVGLVTRNGNALDQTILGGGASGCGTGFKVITGSIQLIMNVGLAENNYDIDIQSNCVNAIIGCRTESNNFINGGAGTFSIISCAHHGNGYFINNLNGSCLISASQATNGKIGGRHGPLDIRASDFGTLVFSPPTVTGAANNGSGLIRLTISPNTFKFITGDQVKVSNISGTGGLPAAANGTWIITVIDSTHLDLQRSSFTGSYSSGGFVTPTPNNHLRNYLGPVASSYGKDYRESHTTDHTIKRAFSGTQYDNSGARGSITFTLPSMNDTDAYKPGTKFGFYVAAAQALSIQAANSMKIRVAGAESAANGTVSSNSVGNYIEIECLDGDVGVDATKWVAKSVVGTWTVT